MINQDRPRILLVSIGSYGQKYLDEATRKDVGGDVVAVVDVAPNLEEKFPVLREKRIPVYRTLEDFFRVDHADLAVISAPIHLHVPMALACLRQGAHVLCEKPLCLTEEETNALSAAARAANRFLAVGWQQNYDPAILRLKKDILSGRFGAPRRFRCLHAMRRGEVYYARNNWAGKIAVDGIRLTYQRFKKIFSGAEWDALAAKGAKNNMAGVNVPYSVMYISMPVTGVLNLFGVIGEWMERGEKA